jgi:hypothetical protein
MYKVVVDFFLAIPAAFWGVVVGSFFSIMGVSISNRASDRRMLAQFDHESRTKTKEREMVLRKDVFLAAAEAISIGMGSLGRFTNFEIANDQVLAPYSEKSHVLAKVHVIASTETVLSLTRFTTHLSELQVALFARRQALMADKNMINVINVQIARFEKERDKLLELMRQGNIEGAVDSRKWDVLSNNFEFEAKRIEQSSRDRDSLLQALQVKQLEYMRESISSMEQLGASLIPVLLAVRNELELPIDEAAYRQVMEESYAIQQRVINEFVEKISPRANLLEKAI